MKTTKRTTNLNIEQLEKLRKKSMLKFTGKNSKYILSNKQRFYKHVRAEIKINRARKVDKIAATLIYKYTEIYKSRIRDVSPLFKPNKNRYSIKNNTWKITDKNTSLSTLKKYKKQLKNGVSVLKMIKSRPADYGSSITAAENDFGDNGKNSPAVISAILRYSSRSDVYRENAEFRELAIEYNKTKDKSIGAKMVALENKFNEDRRQAEIQYNQDNIDDLVGWENMR